MALVLLIITVVGVAIVSIPTLIKSALLLVVRFRFGHDVYKNVKSDLEKPKLVRQASLKPVTPQEPSEESDLES